MTNNPDRTDLDQLDLYAETIAVLVEADVPSDGDISALVRDDHPNADADIEEDPT